MTELEVEEDLSEAEGRLARQLLGSARADEVSAAEIQSAWTKLVGALSVVALQASPPAPSEPAASALGRAKRVAAVLSCLVLGAMAGSAVTAIWRASPPPAAPPARSRAVAAAPAEVSAAPPVASAAPVETPSRLALPRARRASPPAPPGSTLAAEVAQLDAARTALEIGAFDQAKRLVAEFPRKFPRGELRVEAELLRLEVLTASGDYAGAQRDGSRFLTNHANDPHADRVRQLMEEPKNR